MYSTFNNNTIDSSIDSSNDSEIDSSNDSSNDSSICYICFENKQKLKLECGHTICKECLITFLKSSLHNNCPWCRRGISTKEIKKLIPSESKRIFYTNNCYEFLIYLREVCFIFLIFFVFAGVIYSSN